MEWLDALFDYLEHYHPLTEAFRRQLEEKLAVEEFDATAVVLQEGEIADKAWWIQRGYARGYYEVTDDLGNSKQVTVGFWKPGVILTVSDSFFNRTPALHRVEFAARSQTLCISYEQFRELAAETEAANELAVKLTSAHYTETLDRSELLKLSPEDRYRQFLDYYGAAIEQCFYLRDIASFLDMAQETLSRLRSGMI